MGLASESSMTPAGMWWRFGIAVFILCPVIVGSMGCSRVSGVKDPASFVRLCGSGTAADVSAVLKSRPELANATNGEGESALHRAASCGNVETVEVLIKHGATVDGADPVDKTTPLVEAIVMRHPRVVWALLDAGANPNKHVGSTTPLNTAIRRGDLEVVRALVQHGADVDAAECTNGRMTPLFVAECERRRDISALLRAHGAKVNR